MKYRNHFNWLLVLIAGVAILYSFAQTFWGPQTSSPQSSEIPRVRPSGGRSLPGVEAPTPPEQSPTPPSVLQEGIPIGVPSSRTPATSSGSTPRNPGQTRVISTSTRPRAKRKATGSAKSPQSEKEIRGTRRPSSPLPRRLSHVPGTPSPAASAAKKRNPDPTPPPVRSSMPEQQLPR